MMNKILKKRLAVLTVIALAFLALAVCFAFLSAYTDMRTEFAVAAALSCAASGALIVNAFIYAKSEAEFISALEKNGKDSAYIRYNYKNHTAVASENFSELTGVELASVTIGEEQYSKIISELTSSVAEPENNIFMAPVPEKWIRLTEFKTEKYCFITVTDVSKYIVCRNLINSLRYYDTATGVLTRDSFMAKVRSASENNNDSDAIGIIHIVINGIDKVISFAGTAAADGVIGKVASYIKKYENPHNIFTGRTATSEFSMLITETYDDGCRKMAEKVCAGIQETLSSLPDSEKTHVKVFCGYACFHGSDNDLATMISSADFAAFDAEKRGSAVPVPYSSENFRSKAQEFRKAQIFNSLVTNNNIDYHFQPIVNARTGAIFAYEALMRPRAMDGIKLSPLEMLDIAEQEEMLYEIERITFTSTLKHLSENQDVFSNKKMFINCIPNKVLSEDDYVKLIDNYGSIFKQVVVEITEGSPILSDATELINKRYRSHRAQVALDDYGTGYSNESTLLAVKPDYIKIDRSIIMDIDKNPQKQHLAANMVNFCAQHGIMVLAEGVETVEELETVISLHVDFIQGFYTGKASAVLILEIPSDIQNQIINFNLKYNGSVSKSYEINDKKPVNIVDLAIAGYTDITVKSKHAYITGDPEIPVKVAIVSDAEPGSQITMTDVNIECSEQPAITILKGGDVNLKLSGKNTFSRGGIRVPEETKLYIAGGGELNITCDKVNSFAIGGNNMQDYGSISVDFDGKITIHEKGDYVVGIGGGIGSAKSTLDFISGSIEMQLNARDVVGIGSYVNDTVINMNPMKFALVLAGQNAVAIGSKNGHVTIKSTADVEAIVSGDSCCGMGTLERGSGFIIINGGKDNITVRGKNIVGIGAVNGETETVLNSGFQNILCEGDNATCVGDNFGSGCVKCRGGSINAIARASNENPIGVKNGRVYVTGGSIDISGTEPLKCYSLEEIPLVRRTVSGREEFVRKIEMDGNAHMFAAKPIDQDTMYVYLPKEYAED